MSFNVSLLDATFVALLGILALIRLVGPARYQLPLLLAGSAALVGFGSPRTMVVITGLTLGFIFPLHRLIKRAVNQQWPRAIAASLLPGGLMVLVSLLVFFKI